VPNPAVGHVGIASGIAYALVDPAIYGNWAGAVSSSDIHTNDWDRDGVTKRVY